MKILHLTLKKKWFDMIASGEKKEEYREIKPYWAKRLFDYTNETAPEEKGGNKFTSENICFDIENGHYWEDVIKSYNVSEKQFDVIVFKNGYSKSARLMTIKYEGLAVGPATPEWSDNWEGEVFIIKLGKIISNGD